jgi:NTE family protein
MRDIRARPRIVINATDLYTSTPFAFTAPYFEAICSDLGEVRVADAVGASMAVPLAFRPIIAATNAGECPAPLPAWVGEAARDRSAPVMLRETARAFETWRDPETAKFLHLADGGLADNFGLSTLITMRRAAQAPYGPFSARDAVRLRRLAFIVVNAEMAPAGDWALAAKGPNGIDMVDATLNVAVNAPKRLAYDAFSATLETWERDLVAWRCGLTADEARAMGAGEGWRCDDVSFRLDMASFRDLQPEMADRLGAAPTQVSLPADLIDDLIAAGRVVALSNPLLQDLMK